MVPKTISVIGGLDADLIMIASRVPGPGESVAANEFLEALGGKGANSAIAAYRSCHKKDESKVQTANKQDSIASLTNDATRDGADIQVKMIGAVGNDRYGRMFIDKFNESWNLDSARHALEHLLRHGGRLDTRESMPIHTRRYGGLEDGSFRRARRPWERYYP